jgi:hypothetical protein
MRRIFLTALAVTLLGGCYTVSYSTKLAGSETYRQERGDFFFWGLAGDKTIDMKAMCPEGVSRWKSEATFVDGVLGIVTLGIYVPRHVTVECAGGKAWNITVDRDGARVAAVEAPAHAG